jgi:hypothetical protein
MIGGIFAEVQPFDLTTPELETLREAATRDWSAVRPEIFGTLFEGSMAADERHAQGACTRTACSTRRAARATFSTSPTA